MVFKDCFKAMSTQEISFGVKMIVVMFLLFLLGWLVINMTVGRHAKLWTEVHVSLAEMYDLDYGTFIHLSEGSKIRFYDYMVGPGKLLSTKQLKAIRDVIAETESRDLAVLQCIEIIRKDLERENELEQWIIHSQQ